MAESNTPKFIRRQGQLGWLSDGQFYPIEGISGGADDGDDSEDDDGDGGGSTGSGGLSQDEVQRIAAKEKREGKRSGQRELLEALGFDSLDDAKAAVERAREADDAARDEQTRAREEAAEAKRKADAATQTASMARHEVAVIKGLLKAGSDPETVDDLVPMVKAEVGADADEIQDAISSLKEKFPALFESNASASEDDDSGEDTGGGTPDSNPGPAKKGEKKKGTAEDRARERLIANGVLKVD